MEGKNKVYQLSVKKTEDGIYDVYLGDIKLYFQVRRHPDLKDEDVSENDALDLAARFISKRTKYLVRRDNDKKVK